VKTFLPRRILCHAPLSRNAGFLERAQSFSEISVHTGTDILEGSTPPCADMLPESRGQNVHRLPVRDFLPRSRSIQGPWATPLDPHLLGYSTWWPEPCCRLARLHWSPVAGTHTGPRNSHWSPGPTLVPGPTAIPRHPTSLTEAPPAELTREHGVVRVG
jgi:hypothetical protein